MIYIVFHLVIGQAHSAHARVPLRTPCILAINMWHMILSTWCYLSY